MRDLPQVTIIILTWNASRFLPACLKTLLTQDYPAFSLIIVDNDSTDDTVAVARSLQPPTAFPAVQLIENRANLGFAGGNNVALRQIESPFVVLLNPDVELARNWLSELIAPMLSDPKIGVAGCKIYEPDGITLQHAGGYITRPQALSGHFGLGERDIGQHDEIRDAEYVMGAAMAIRPPPWTPRRQHARAPGPTRARAARRAARGVRRGALHALSRRPLPLGDRARA